MPSNQSPFVVSGTSTVLFKIPIIATGGIINGKDAIEMLMAGGSLLGIGSAIVYHDMKAFDMITDKIRDFMKQESMTDISELVGIAHEEGFDRDKLSNEFQ